MQKVYCSIFNIIYRATGKLSTGVRDGLMLLCCLVLMWVYFFSELKLGSGEVQILGTAIVVVMTLLSVDRELEPVRWNRLTYYPMVLFGLGMIIIGQIHSVGDGYMMYAVDLMLIFPAFYYVWAGRGDIEKLYTIISAAIIIFGFASFVYCFWLAARGELQMMGDRVRAFKTNANYLGMFGVLMLASGLYLAAEKRERWQINIISALSIGIGLVYSLITVSRTAMLSEILCLIAFAVYFLKPSSRRQRQLKISGRRLACCALIALVMFALGLRMDDINYAALQKASAAGTEAVEQAATNEAAAEEQSDTNEAAAEEQSDTNEAPAAEQSETPPAESADVQEPGSEEYNGNEADKLTERFDVSDDAYTLSSGRTQIWKIYADEFSLWGKSYKEIKPELKAAVEHRAHNNIVDYLFRCGYIVGGIYILFYIMQGITGLKLLFSSKYNRPALIYTIMLVGAYSVYAMLEISTLAFIRIIPCIYFITLAPIITDER